MIASTLRLLRGPLAGPRVRQNFRGLSWLGTIAVVALAALASAPGLAQNAPPASPYGVVVLESLVVDGLSPLGPGCVEWVREQLRSAGIAVAPGSATRPLRPPRGSDPGEATRSRIAQAARLGAPLALLVDLRSSRRGIEIGLRVHDSTSGALLFGRLADSTSSTLAEDATYALRAVLPTLGATGRLGAPVPVTPDQLTAFGRGLEAYDRRDLAGAWREVERSIVPGAETLRQEIVAAADLAATPPAETARLLAARGEPGRAWSLISESAEKAAARRVPPHDSALLVAAGEIQLERGRAAEARRYFEKSLEVDERDAAAALGLGRVLQAQNKPADAQRALERAARLDRTSPLPVELLAESAADPARKARLLVAVAGREARRLSVGRARVFFDRAGKADPAVLPDTYERAGRLQTQLGDVEQARASYESAIQTGGPTG